MQKKMIAKKKSKDTLRTSGRPKVVEARQEAEARELQRTRERLEAAEGKLVVMTSLLQEATRLDKELMREREREQDEAHENIEELKLTLAHARHILEAKSRQLQTSNSELVHLRREVARLSILRLSCCNMSA
jgi:hypothetical protein